MILSLVTVISFVKRPFLALAISLVFVSGAFSASVSYTNSITLAGNLGSGVYSNLTLGKFNSDLGDLTQIVVTINFVDVGGSFTISDAVDDGTFNFAAAKILVRQTNASYGFTNVSSSNNVTTTPGNNTPILTGSSQTFTVANQRVMESIGQTITGTNFFSAYQSAGGAGTIFFQIRNQPTISTTYALGDATLDVSGFTAAASMSVNYTYTPFGPEPVPEPATVMAGGLLVLIGAGTYLRRRVKSGTRQF